MSEFNTRPSAAFLKAVEALRALPFGQRGDAYAEATADDLRTVAAKQLGRKMPNRDWEKVAGIPSHHTKRLPADDHGELRKGKVLTYTSQPYQLSLDEMREIVRLCDEHRMGLTVDARSWYYPGATIRMTYQKREKSN